MFRRNFENEVDQLLDICFDNGIGENEAEEKKYKDYNTYYDRVLEKQQILFVIWLLSQKSYKQIDREIRKVDKYNYRHSACVILEEYWNKWKNRYNK